MADEIDMRLKGKAYLRKLENLHIELVKLQEWAKHTGAKISIISLRGEMAPGRAASSKPSPNV